MGRQLHLWFIFVVVFNLEGIICFGFYMQRKRKLLQTALNLELLCVFFSFEGISFHALFELMFGHEF